MTVRVRARQRHEVVLAEHAVRLVGDRPDHVGEGDPPLQVLRQHVAARVGGRLEADAGDPGPFQPEPDDRADLVVVDARLERADQRRLDPAPAQGLDGPELGLDQRLAAEHLRAAVVEPVELEVDLDPVLEPLDAVEQLGVVGQPDAVGVDHHDVDRLSGGVLEHAEELGVDRRLAPGELKHLGPALDRDQPVDRPDAFVVAQMNAARPAGSVAHRAAQVA